MSKIKAVIVGYGNLGRYSIPAINSTQDIELLSVISTSPERVKKDVVSTIRVENNIDSIKEKPDVALLTLPSRLIEKEANRYLKKGIATVDSYDEHSNINTLYSSLDKVAMENNTVAIISAGWDPGTDSLVRSVFEIIAPNGITYTNFGEGMSMGHSVAVRAIEGVQDAISITIPKGQGIHRRMVYVVIKEGYNKHVIEQSIKQDQYFVHDETYVKFVDSKTIDGLKKEKSHGVDMTRKGVSGDTCNQLLEFNMKINNPAATSTIMVNYARAAARLKSNGQYGCYTVLDIPLKYCLPYDNQEIFKLI